MRTNTPLPFLLLSLVAASIAIGCTKGESSTPPPPAPAITSVSVSPATATVQAGQTQQFTATVTGTGNFNNAVTWSVQGVGSISSSGLYTAPTTLSAATSVTVVATSVADATKSASASLTVQPPPTITSVSVSPATATVQAGQTQQFTATVTGTGNFNNAVTWSVSSGAGSIDSSGRFTAPNVAGSATIKAVSVQDPAKFGMATITVTNPVPNIASITPRVVRTGRPGEWTLTVRGSGFIGSSTVHVNGGSRTTTFTSDTRLTASMPAIDAATTGQLAITVVSPAPGGGTSNTANIRVDTAASVAEVSSLTLTDPDPTHLFGAKVKAVDGVFGDGKKAIAIAANNGVYLVHDPDSHPGNFTVS